MKDGFSAIAEPLVEATALLSPLERRVFEFVLESWPVGPLDVAVHLGAEVSSLESKKRASTKFSYYLKKLVGKRLLFSKRMGNSLVVWPVEVEKYRAFHSILSSNASHAHLAEAKKNLDSADSPDLSALSSPKGVS